MGGISLSVTSWAIRINCYLVDLTSSNGFCNFYWTQRTRELSEPLCKYCPVATVKNRASQSYLIPGSCDCEIIEVWCKSWNVTFTLSRLLHDFTICNGYNTYCTLCTLQTSQRIKYIIKTQALSNAKHNVRQ